MEHFKEQPSALRMTANRYQGTLRDYVARLKKGGLTEHEAKAIYKVIIPRLNRLAANASPQDKAALIERAVVDVLGPTRYQIIRALTKTREGVKFRIDETLDEADL